MTIICIGNTVGVFSFADGFIVRREESVLEWARKDLLTCVSWLLKHGYEDTAEMLWEKLA